jgi:hypothetical protein
MRAIHTALGPDHWRSVAAAFIALGELAHADDFPDKDELRGIRTPTPIVHGDRDRWFPVEVPLELYRLLPDAELCLLPRTGHARRKSARPGSTRTCSTSWRGGADEAAARPIGQPGDFPFGNVPP